jgi:hypothetical protein
MHAVRQRRYREIRKKVTHQLARIGAKAARVEPTNPPVMEAARCCVRCGRRGVVDGTG